MKANYNIRVGVCPMCDCQVDEYRSIIHRNETNERHYTCKACAFEGYEVFVFTGIRGINEETGELEQLLEKD